jgi:hypothetical protein
MTPQSHNNGSNYPAVLPQVRSYFTTPEVHIMELSRKPGFIFYKLIEALVEQLADVLVPYRRELLTAEERTFKQVCVTTTWHLLLSLQVGVCDYYVALAPVSSSRCVGRSQAPVPALSQMPFMSRQLCDVSCYSLYVGLSQICCSFMMQDRPNKEDDARVALS